MVWILNEYIHLSILYILNLTGIVIKCLRVRHVCLYQWHLVKTTQYTKRRLFKILAFTHGHVMTSRPVVDSCRRLSIRLSMNVAMSMSIGPPVDAFVVLICSGASNNVFASVIHRILRCSVWYTSIPDTIVFVRVLTFHFRVTSVIWQLFVVETELVPHQTPSIRCNK